VPTVLRDQLQVSLGDGYALERELGGGGMSLTYVATEHALARRVVVKMLSPELAAGVSVERFRREILLAAKLQHPHVVPVLSTGVANGLPWFTMPYVEGESLRIRLSRGPLRIGEVIGILRDVARALAFAHSHGVVHRDIKPDNVLLSQGSATVTDFGIAKAISAARTDAPGGTLTVAGTSLGTPAYMSPEQCAGDPGIDHRSDIYAFGAMAYELLGGRPPFQGSSPAKILGAHLGETPKDIRELRADTPPLMADLVMQCLAKDPDARPQQATDLVRVLDSVTSSGTAATAPSVLAGRMPVGRAVALWGASTALVALTAWAATVVIGLPDWVIPGSLGVMLAGLPVIVFTAWVQRTTHKMFTATPTFTPGGTPSMQGTLATLAVKASPHVSWRRTWMGGAVAVGGFVILVVGFMVLRALGIGPAGSLIGAGKLSADEQLIITDFRGPAGDSTLGVTVTEALRADLAQSSALKLVPRLTVIQTLRLMQRPEDASIDFGLAREIASREGIKAVLDGNVVSLGGRYVVSTRLVSAQSGEELASFSQEAASQNDLIPAISRLGKQLRAKVGESLKSVREASALERVTTGSMEALRKYAAALAMLEQTSDYTRVIPLLEQAVAIDSTFAMAWRRLAAHLSTVGEQERARAAVTQAYRYRDRLSEVEKQLTIASYFGYGPKVDEERALEAYDAVLALDPQNLIALNNASLILANRREYAKVADYRLRAAAQDKNNVNPITWGNAIGGLITAGRIDAADSLLRVWLQRMPDNPSALLYTARMAYQRGDYDAAERIYTEIRPRLASSRTTTDNFLGDMATLATLRGRVGDAAKYRAEQRTRQAERGRRMATLRMGMDSVMVSAVVLDNAAGARAVLHRAIERMPIDSLPLVEQPAGELVTLAAYAGDADLARRFHAVSQRVWEDYGNSVDRPAWEAFEEGQVAFAEGRFADALAKYDESDRRLLPCTECLAASRFLANNRLQRADSAIAAGEAFLAVKRSGRVGNDATFQPAIRQRLGELYEAKGNLQKAIEHYTVFVTLWKNADAELQPRVKDVQARIERLRAEIGKGK
jgi:tetratricopeptide (TPR) repeat protein/tRNA A-37 threonylcarbamoyl transferase component Bud32